MIGKLIIRWAVVAACCMSLLNSNLGTAEAASTAKKSSDAKTTVVDAIIVPQNQTSEQKQNGDASKQQIGKIEKHDHSKETKRKPQVRQVDTTASALASSAGDMKAEQSFYPGSIYAYPFPLINSYFPRYYPYGYGAYPGHAFGGYGFGGHAFGGYYGGYGNFFG